MNKTQNVKPVHLTEKVFEAYVLSADPGNPPAGGVLQDAHHPPDLPGEHTKRG